MAGALVNELRHLRSADNQRGGHRRTPPRAEQGERFFADARRMCLELEAFDVLVAGGRKIATLPTYGSRHALRIRTPLEVRTVRDARHKSGATFGDGLLDQRAFAAREQLGI